jgi:hypothetical protein
MVSHRHIDIKMIQIMSGLAILIIAGFAAQWWLWPGTALFCAGLILLCIVTIEKDIADNRS